MNILLVTSLIALYIIVIFLTYLMLQRLNDGTTEKELFVTMSILWPITYIFLIATFPYFYTIIVIKKYKSLNKRIYSPRDFIRGKFDDIFDVKSYWTHRLIQ